MQDDTRDDPKEMMPLSQVNLPKRMNEYFNRLMFMRLGQNDFPMVIAKMLVHIEALEHLLESQYYWQRGDEFLVPNDARRLKDWFGD